MTKQQKADLKMSARLGDAITLLHIHGLMTDAEMRKVVHRYVKAMAKRSITVRQHSIADWPVPLPSAVPVATECCICRNPNCDNPNSKH